MSEALNAAIAELETKAAEYDAQAARHRAGAAELRKLLVSDATTDKTVSDFVSKVPPTEKEPRRKPHVVTRTFKCERCKKISDAAPYGPLPSICKECKDQKHG